MKNLLGKMRRCINDFDMIQEGDKICVGLSAGKDSMSLLYLLSEFQKFSPQRFEIIALTVDIGTDSNFNEISNFCSSIGVEYHVIKTNIKTIVFDVRKEKNPCSLCSKLKKGALNNYAKQFGCNKLALGHNSDDAIETLLMSMFFEGRVHCFLPKTYLSRKDITLIRPLLYITENETRSLVHRFNIPIVTNLCGVDGTTKREYIKQKINSLKKEVPDIKQHLMSCLMNNNKIELWNKKNK